MISIFCYYLGNKYIDSCIFGVPSEFSESATYVSGIFIFLRIRTFQVFDVFYNIVPVFCFVCSFV